MHWRSWLSMANQIDECVCTHYSVTFPQFLFSHYFHRHGQWNIYFSHPFPLPALGKVQLKVWNQLSFDLAFGVSNKFAPQTVKGSSHVNEELKALLIETILSCKNLLYNLWRCTDKWIIIIAQAGSFSWSSNVYAHF